MPAPTRLLRPLPLLLALQAVLTSGAWAASFTVPSGTNSAPKTLANGGDSGTIASGAALSVNDSKAAIDITASSGTVTIDNAGRLTNQTGRAIDNNKDGVAVVINNQGSISTLNSDAIRFNKANSTLVLNNNGSIVVTGSGTSGGQALDLRGAEGSAAKIINNGSVSNRSALIQSNNDDALRPGKNTTINNYGSILASGVVNSKCPDYLKAGCDVAAAGQKAPSAHDAIDAGEMTGVTVNNWGTIAGPRHAITADFDIRVSNYQGGEIIGRNGSGVGSDGVGTVLNYGLISGRYAGAGNSYDHFGDGRTSANGDGDGVDIDGMASIDNYGRIEGLGAGGVDSGGLPNGAEGIAAGGGSIVNRAGAQIFGQSAGILIDDGANGSAIAAGRGTASAAGGAASISNAGSIVGADKAAIGLVGDFADSLDNLAGGLIRGGAQTVRVDQLHSTTASAAVQMGAGNDRLSNHGSIEGQNGLAVDMGNGDDLLLLGHSGRFVGSLDGGSGRDRVQLDDTLGGSFGNSRNFERLEVRSGSWTLNSAGDFSEGGQVFGGATLINQGNLLGNLQVDSGARYAGSGRIGGNLQLASGANLGFALSPSAAQAPIQVGGQASLAGAQLQLNASPGVYPWHSAYRVLQADGGVSGQFAGVSSNLAFLTPSLSYSANAVDLQLARNDVQFSDTASSANGRQVGASVSALALANPLYGALLTSSQASAGEALEQLSASANASLANAMLGSSAQVGSSMLAALQSPAVAGGLQTALLEGDAPLLAATGLPAGVRNLNDPQAQGRLWLQGLGSHGRVDGSAGSSDLDQNTGGVVLGADWGLDSEWCLGLLGGYSRTDLQAGSAFDGDVDSLHVGVYALRQSGPLALRLGAAYSRHDGDSKREVDFNGFTDRLRGDYDADSQQAFAELGYAMGSGNLSAEPFANLGYQRYSRDAYSEDGGAAALRVEAQEQDNLTSTLGLRIARLDTLSNGIGFTPRLSVAWRHTYGDVDSRTSQAFLSGGSGFSVEGSALDRNSLLLGVGADFRLSASQQVGLGYSGELGSNAQNHALLAQWQMGF
ncbi:autotransporter outer membrane beta-barrel domain-containing protein [Pseudomonas sp. LS44]|uniref:autotransporter family protein n=1 Tax=Pseudomonas sp. LS44 TaxID=1357074 RepID=UPI00215A40A2|nr:autotransporter outer membrane beta-barrel domain-containing protein [Pseudomonas sp. LS44]UVE17791.1 autotransporter outer membrane beta-barrel domain-containing protein [Pseudomonas sp. LS44]